MSYNKIASENKMSHLMVLFAVLMVVVALTGAGCPQKQDLKQPETPVVDQTDTGTKADKLPPQASATATEAVNKNPSANKPAATTPAPTKPVAAANKYKDGSYDAVGDYNSPAGAETINVSVTLKDDVVIAATTVANATNPKSKFMQGEFIGGFKAQVIGKKIDDIMLDKVSGSSLTPKGFNEALVEIKTAAKA